MALAPSSLVSSPNGHILVISPALFSPAGPPESIAIHTSRLRSRARRHAMLRCIGGIGARRTVHVVRRHGPRHRRWHRQHHRQSNTDLMHHQRRRPPHRCRCPAHLVGADCFSISNVLINYGTVILSGTCGCR